MRIRWRAHDIGHELVGPGSTVDMRTAQECRRGFTSSRLVCRRGPACPVPESNPTSRDPPNAARGVYGGTLVVVEDRVLGVVGVAASRAFVGAIRISDAATDCTHFFHAQLGIGRKHEVRRRP